MNEPTPPRLNLIQRAMAKAPTAEAFAPPRREPVAEPVLEAPVAKAPAPAEPVRAPEYKPANGASVTPAATPHGPNTVALNMGRLREGRMVTPDNRASVTYNEFRSIKRKLLPLTRDPETRATTKNIVMITSALAGEGKTYTAINLAICLAAERNLDVILVDGDVVRASVAQYFEGAPTEGLLDLLTGRRQNIDEVLTRCADIPNLHILFSGRRDDSSPELLASQRMAEVCSALSRRFRECVVVIDAPPVLATAEPSALAMHVHHLLMVVAAGQSARHQVEEALAGVVACPSISLIFNKAPEWQRSTPYSYYYSYGEKTG
ncbi:AAA family ATPase [Rhizomicrobium electricum]|jgi:receptor protein-tyrosine kinase|uniref:non-specific protein-tyrosine kinase n=1 Tax=Rhizomicrobium electricum TaxID=480070 RepID=A0ABN1EN60_9PROT|nr:AAA family ATPase [Rhizomicrobium electricum]NIJ46885.1 receptor protein-tyrosine kinase [Rhizomicrobium electricum]